MKIRQEMPEDYAAREEIPDIAAFVDSAWRSAYRGILLPEYLESLSADERSAAFAERFDSGHSRFLVMRDGDDIVGAAVFGRSITEGYPDDGEVSALYLRQDCIGKGHGHTLLSKAERELTGMGYADFVLDVFTANTRAIDFYTAHGYKKVDERLLNLCGTDYPYTVFRKHYEVVAFGLTLSELWRLFPVELAEHDPAWRDWYDDEKSSLLALLGSAVKRIDHIGSTAIDGLLAKPIVDILLQIADDCDVGELKAKLAGGGWLMMAERTEPYPQLDLNKGYTPSGFADKVYHLHVRRVGDWDEPHFRDYIAKHPEAAAEYAALKRRLLAKYKYDRDAYTEAKGEFIRACIAKAREV
jgi:GrpB-like predicted nucleotidyltransferase (UPF0157 family)/ribosomal protein S18 acetylase RimI-like enzyme